MGLYDYLLVLYSSVHVLTTPYVKLDDQSRRYRPLVYETKAWPKASGSTTPNGCPFDKATTRAAGSPNDSHPMIFRTKKPGYCECCSQRYEDLIMVSHYTQYIISSLLTIHCTFCQYIIINFPIAPSQL